MPSLLLLLLAPLAFAAMAQPTPGPAARPELDGPGVYCGPSGWSVRLGPGDSAREFDAGTRDDRWATVTRFRIDGRLVEIFEGLVEGADAPARSGRKVRGFNAVAPVEEFMAFWEVREGDGVEYRLFFTGDEASGDYFIVRSAFFHGYEADLWMMERIDPTSSALSQGSCMPGTRARDRDTPPG